MGRASRTPSSPSSAQAESGHQQPFYTSAEKKRERHDELSLLFSLAKRVCFLLGGQVFAQKGRGLLRIFLPRSVGRAATSIHLVLLTLEHSWKNVFFPKPSTQKNAPTPLSKHVQRLIEPGHALTYVQEARVEWSQEHRAPRDLPLCKPRPSKFANQRSEQLHTRMIGLSWLMFLGTDLCLRCCAQSSVRSLPAAEGRTGRHGA